MGALRTRLRDTGFFPDGSGPDVVGPQLKRWGADAVGVNCATGPAGVYEMATAMLDCGLPVVAIPNAGMPQQVEGRLIDQTDADGVVGAGAFLQ